MLWLCPLTRTKQAALLAKACVKALVRWATGKRLTNRLPKLSLITFPPWNGGSFRSRPDTRVDVSPTRGFIFWGSRESSYHILHTRK